MIISNPIYKELIKLNLIKKKNLLILNNFTRDKKIKVLQDKISKVIFLEKYTTDINYYSALKKDSIKRKNKIYDLTKLNNKNFIKSVKLDDEKRRFKEFKRLIMGKKILDFGCGFGGFLQLSYKTAKKTCGIELRKDCVSFIKKNLKKINVQNNINNFDNNFDLITMFHVLEHIPFQIRTLKNLKKKIKKNGKILIEVPSAQDFLLQFKNLKEFKNFTFWSEHLILHTEQSLRKILNKSGFKKIQIKYYQRYNLANHLGWFINRQPGGHDFFNKIFDKKILNSYQNYLIRNKKTDTLIAIAQA